MDEVDRRIVNGLQGGFPLCERPFAAAAESLGLDEETLIARVQHLLDEGVLSRFGPMYHAERLGGALTLCAMSIADNELERVAEQVNAFDEVAHNYAREHAFNMWFVLATERAERIDEVITEIEHQTGYPVYNMPKIEEFFVGLKFEA